MAFKCMSRKTVSSPITVGTSMSTWPFDDSSKNNTGAPGFPGAPAQASQLTKPVIGVT